MPGAPRWIALVGITVASRMRVDQQPDVDELVGEQLIVLVVELGPQLDRAGGGVDLVVERLQLADAQLGRAGAVVGGHRQGRVGAKPLLDLRQVVLGHREDHADRLQLGDDDDAGRIPRRDVVALVDQTQPDPAAHRRHDVAIGDVELRGIDLRLVGEDVRLILGDQVGLGVELLARYRVGLGEVLIALEIDLRGFEQRLVARKRALRIGERQFVGARVDFRQEIALLDDLAFRVSDVDEIAADLASGR